ncbi:hypothetical protein C8Q80DRAFT_1122537 [Daedaleopsis nitida]|nr:hypothetical protein C8Q80DRAFT_1122537 [Daedaleopsis nitida]
MPFWSLPYQFSLPRGGLNISPPSNHPLMEIRTQEVDWMEADGASDMIAEHLKAAFPYLQTAADEVDFLRNKFSNEPVCQPYIMRSRLNKLSLRVWMPNHLQYDL